MNPVLQEILEERRRYTMTVTPAPVAELRWRDPVAARAELIKLAAAAIATIEEIDRDLAGTRAAELRKRIERKDQDEDVLREPFPRGKST